MSKLPPITSSTPNNSLAYFNFKDQSLLKKVSWIAIPLFLILGTIYYFWRYSKKEISSEEKSISFEQQIETLFQHNMFAEAESLINTLPSEKIDEWKDIYHERLHLKYIREESLTFAYAQALKIKNPLKKDPLLIQVFKACLSKEQLSVPWQLLNGLKDSDSDNLKIGLIEAAQDRETLALAFSPLCGLTSSDERKKWLTILAPKIATSHPELTSFMGYAVHPPERQDNLLEEIILVLIENNFLAPARAFTLLFSDEPKKTHWQNQIRIHPKSSVS